MITKYYNFFIEKIWKDPVWSKVIAATIIGLFVGITAFLIPDFYKLVLVVFNLPFLNLIVQPWQILIFMALPFALKYFYHLSILEKSPQTDIKKSYKKDTFLSLVWRWSFGRDIYNLKAYCPECDYEMPKRYDSFSSYYQSCDDCKFRLPQKLSCSRAEEYVTKKIEKKLRSLSND